MSATPKDYREEIVTTKTWRRSYRIEILNPYLGVPALRFDEEDMREAEGVVSSSDAPGVFCSFDPSRIVPLVDPVTLEPTGDSISMGACYMALFSLYINLARARDAAAEGTP